MAASDYYELVAAHIAMLSLTFAVLSHGKHPELSFLRTLIPSDHIA